MKPLQGKRILVTRPAVQAVPLAEMITAQGGKPLCFPLVETGPVQNPAPLLKMIQHLENYDFTIFVSPNAVNFSLPLILSQRSWPTHVQAAAIGQSTAIQLAAYGIEHIIVPLARFDSEALLELPSFHADYVVGKKILIFQGNGGREQLAVTLRTRGVDVDCVTCYLRSAPVDGTTVLSLLYNNQLDALTVSSSEGLRNLLALLDTHGFPYLHALPVFVSHQRIAELALAQGLQRVVLTGATDAGTIEGLCKYNWLHHEQ